MQLLVQPKTHAWKCPVASLLMHLNREPNVNVCTAPPQIEDPHQRRLSAQFTTIGLDYNQSPFPPQHSKRLSSGSSCSFTSTTLSTASSSNQLQLPPNGFPQKLCRQQSDSGYTWISETVCVFGLKSKSMSHTP